MADKIQDKEGILPVPAADEPAAADVEPLRAPRKYRDIFYMLLIYIF